MKGTLGPSISAQPSGLCSDCAYLSCLLRVCCNAGNATEWLRCETLDELLKAKADMPEACIVAGNTEIGIDMHIKGFRPAKILDPTAVPELQQLSHSDKGMLVRSI